jgi:hypothetical protein
MPSESSGGVLNMWYSFNYGPVHFVQINTETDYPGAPNDQYTYGTGNGGFGDQLAWLEADLKVRSVSIHHRTRRLGCFSGANAESRGFCTFGSYAPAQAHPPRSVQEPRVSRNLIFLSCLGSKRSLIARLDHGSWLEDTDRCTRSRNASRTGP